MTGSSEKFNFFDTSKMPCKEGDFLFSTDPVNGGEPEVVLLVTPIDFQTYCPSAEKTTRRKWTDFASAKLRVGNAEQGRKMIGHYLTELAIEQSRINAKRDFWAKLSVGELQFEAFFMLKQDING